MHPLASLQPRDALPTANRTAGTLTFSKHIV